MLSIFSNKDRLSDKGAYVLVSYPSRRTLLSSIKLEVYMPVLEKDTGGISNTSRKSPRKRVSLYPPN